MVKRHGFDEKGRKYMKTLGEDSYRDLSGIGIPVAKKCKALARDSLSLLAYVK